jgi:hypothetical protein
MLGVMIKLMDDQHSIHPPALHSMAAEAMNSMDGGVAFTMASDITATLFRQMSPYQSEILVQPQGIRIPIVDSLEDVIYLGTTKKMRGSSCIVRKDKVIVVWSNSVENILPHGAELEKLLLETVSRILNFERNMTEFRRCGAKHLAIQAGEPRFLTRILSFQHLGRCIRLLRRARALSIMIMGSITPSLIRNTLQKKKMLKLSTTPNTQQQDLHTDQVYSLNCS